MVASALLRTRETFIRLPEYFRVLISVVILVVCGCFLEAKFQLNGRGTNSIFIFLELLACIVLVQKARKINFGKAQFLYFFLFHFFLLLADTGYTLIYYFWRFERPLSIHTIYLCSTFGLSFLTLGLFFYESLAP